MRPHQYKMAKQDIVKPAELQDFPATRLDKDAFNQNKKTGNGEACFCIYGQSESRDALRARSAG